MLFSLKMFIGTLSGRRAFSEVFARTLAVDHITHVCLTYYGNEKRIVDRETRFYEQF